MGSGGKWSVLYLMNAAIFIITLDTTMMSVSLSALVRDLGTTVEGLQGAITLYSLVMAAFMIPGAKLADIWGTKKVFVVGLAIYTVGTLMATFATNLWVLILGWSVLEGIGGAMVLPVTVTYITKSYEGKARAFAFSSWGAINGVAASLGPIIGGALTTYITWRLGFFLEAFIAGGIFAYMKILPDFRPERRIKLDVVGSILIGIGLFLITLSVLLLDPLGDEPVISLFLVGILFVILFAIYEMRLTRRGGDLLFDINIFRSKTFVSVNIISLTYQMGIAGLLFIIPVFLQTYLMYNAISTGLVLLPMSLMLFVFSMANAYLEKYLSPKRIIQLGIILSFAGFYLMYSEFQERITGLALAPGLAIYGMGIGMVAPELTNMAMSSAERSQQADASGMFSSLRNLGYSLGTAVMGAILITGIIESITNQIFTSGVFEGASREEIRDAVVEWFLKMKQGTVIIPPEYHDIIVRMVDTAIIDSMRLTLLFLMAILLLGAVVSFFLPKGDRV